MIGVVLALCQKFTLCLHTITKKIIKQDRKRQQTTKHYTREHEVNITPVRANIAQKKRKRGKDRKAQYNT